MKLNATTKSERGKSVSKTGNDYICIKLTVQNGPNLNYPIGEIILDYMDDVSNFGSNQNEWVLKYLPHTKYDPDIIDRANVEPPTKPHDPRTCENSVPCQDCEQICDTVAGHYCGTHKKYCNKKANVNA